MWCFSSSFRRLVCGLFSSSRAWSRILGVGSEVQQGPWSHLQQRNWVRTLFKTLYGYHGYACALWYFCGPRSLFYSPLKDNRAQKADELWISKRWLQEHPAGVSSPSSSLWDNQLLYRWAIFHPPQLQRSRKYSYHELFLVHVPCLKDLNAKQTPQATVRLLKGNQHETKSFTLPAALVGSLILFYLIKPVNQDLNR